MFKIVLCAGLSFSISAGPFAGFDPARDTEAKLATTTIALEPVLSIGLTNPVFVTNARDGTNRLFILEQAGIIKLLQPGGASASVFLDLTAKVMSGEERGLLGLAFHPNYTTNRRFFVYYTRKPDGTIVIAEYLVSSSNPNLAETAEKVILTVAHPIANHNGGTLEFGPDNFLYMGLGDGAPPGPSNPAQNKEELLGKILRIDIDTPNGSIPYSSPPSNPFFGSIPGRDEIYALGLRNPWRFSFDRVTGEIYAADVGQLEREEIDLITLGGNFGWSVFEGTLCTDTEPALCIPGNFIPPLAEYTHAGGRCTIIGGYVYRGSKSTLPKGTYVYGDHCTGEIFLWESEAQNLLLDTSLVISSFGEDENGEIYVVGYEGSIHRIISPVNASSLEIQMSKTTYIDGDMVTATEFRIKNPGAAAKIEMKVWLTIPGMAPISILNLGGDGSFVVESGTNQNLGPMTLFTVSSSMPRGSYEFNARMLNPVTGKLVSADLNTFLIQ